MLDLFLYFVCISVAISIALIATRHGHCNKLFSSVGHQRPILDKFDTLRLFGSLHVTVTSLQQEEGLLLYCLLFTVNRMGPG